MRSFRISCPISKSLPYGGRRCFCPAQTGRPSRPPGGRTRRSASTRSSSFAASMASGASARSGASSSRWPRSVRCVLFFFCGWGYHEISRKRRVVDGEGVKAIGHPRQLEAREVFRGVPRDLSRKEGRRRRRGRGSGYPRQLEASEVFGCWVLSAIGEDIGVCCYRKPGTFTCVSTIASTTLLRTHDSPRTLLHPQTGTTRSLSRPPRFRLSSVARASICIYAFAFSPCGGRRLDPNL